MRRKLAAARKVRKHGSQHLPRTFSWRALEQLEARLLLDGNPLDLTFGQGGTAQVELRERDVPRAVALQPDGKILVAGYTYDTGDDAAGFVIRLLENGTLDESFDDDGIALFDWSSGHDLIHALAIQPDGGIVLAGTSDSAGVSSAVLARLDDSGRMDGMFGAGGFASFGGNLQLTASQASAVLLDPIGTIYVGGSVTTDNDEAAAIFRFVASGQADVSFSDDGVSVLPQQASVATLARQSTGAIAYTAGGQVGRVDVSGEHDPEFSTAIYSYGLPDWPAVGASIVDEDRIVLGFDAPSIPASAVLYFSSSGQFEAEFEGSATLTTGLSLAMQSQQRSLVAGMEADDQAQRVAFLRTNSDGTGDRTFDNDAILVTNLDPAFDPLSEQNIAFASTPGDEIIVAGWKQNSAGIAIQRLIDDDRFAPTFKPIQPDFADGRVTEASGYLRLEMSEDIVGGETPANFELRGFGPDNLIHTPDDVLYETDTIVGWNVVTLLQPSFPLGSYRFTARDTLTDPAGRRLDGDGDGIEGGDYHLDFTVFQHVPPRIANVVPSLGDTIKSKEFNSLTLHLTRPLVGPVSLESIRLRRLPHDSLAGEEISVQAAANSTSYQLQFESLRSGTYELTIDDPRLDDQGRAFDGDGDDLDGGIYRRVFEVQWPAITGVVSTSVDHGILPAESNSIHLWFSHSLHSTWNIQNFVQLLSSGADQVIGTGDDQYVPHHGSFLGDRSSLSFDPLAPGTYRLQFERVFNTDGVLVDGNGDGEPGGTWLRDFVVDDNPEDVLAIRHEIAVGSLNYLDESHFYPERAAIDQDGSIIAVGRLVDQFTARETLCLARFTADGRLMESFGNGGHAVLPFWAYRGSLRIGIGIDRSIMVLGIDEDSHENPLLALARYTSDGQLDIGFASFGHLTQAMQLRSYHAELIRDEQGNTVVVTHGSPSSLTFHRFTADGSTAWPATQNTYIPRFIRSVDAIVKLRDGRILVGGSFGDDLDWDGFVVALNSDGSIDRSFANQGYLDFDEEFSVVAAVLELDHGGLGIIAARRPGDSITLRRFDASGRRESVFGEQGDLNFVAEWDGNGPIVRLSRWSAGTFAIALGDIASSTRIIQIRDDGTLLPTDSTLLEQTSLAALHGATDNGLLLLGESDTGWIRRIRSTGQIDLDFGEQGAATLRLEPQNSVGGGITSLLSLADSSTLTIGWLARPGGDRYELFAAKTLANGRVDTTFGTNGWLILPSVGGEAQPAFALLRPDGGVVIVLVEHRAEGPRTLFLGLQADASVDEGFGLNGVASTDGIIHDVALQGDMIVYLLRTKVGRIRRDGTEDSMWTDGAKLQATGYSTSLGVHPDGSILIVDGLFVTKLLPSGDLDLSFGRLGRASLPYLLYWPPREIHVTQTHVTVVSKYTEGLLVSRYRANGEPDLSFNNSGHQAFVLPLDQIADIWQGPDDSILFSGSIAESNYIARIDFNAESGRYETLPRWSNLPEQISYPVVAPSTNGEVLVAGMTHSYHESNFHFWSADLGMNTAPTAAIGGPYFVSREPELVLDASLSTDSETSSIALTYEWDLDYDGGQFDVDAAGIRPSVLLLRISKPQQIALRVSDPQGESSIATTFIQPSARIVGQHLFYNNSAFDGYDPAANSADASAIATDKQPLIAGNRATFVNYSSYVHGINGIIIDVAGLPGQLTSDDFEFRVGNSDDATNWIAAPAPAITLGSGQGAGGSDRITLIWTDGAIVNRWLQVVVKASAATGLVADDVFYFGNAIAESGTNPLTIAVTAADEIAARNNPRDAANPAAVDFAFDYDRDGLVDGTDQTIARTNRGSRQMLSFLEPTTSLRSQQLAATDAALAAAQVWNELLNVKPTKRRVAASALQ